MSFITKIVRNVFRYKYSCQIIMTSRSLDISSRHFSCNSMMCIKMFMEHENQYAYDLMRSKGYAIDIESTRLSNCGTLDKDKFNTLIEQDWSKKTPAQIFEIFPKLGVYCKENKMCISDAIFDNYIDHLTDSLCRATDDELVSVFYGFNLWPETTSIRTRNYIEVWVALDDACTNRLSNWSPDEMLSFVSLFYMLNVSRVSDSTKKMLNKLTDKAKNLTPNQLVRTLFFVGIQRVSPFNMHNLEVQLHKNISQFSVDELAIMSMGFFKSKTPIRSNDLVLKIIEQVIQYSRTIHEVSLAALLKIIRYSLKMPLDEGFYSIHKLLDSLQHEIPRLSLMCNVHIALLGTSKLILHEGCLNSIAEKLVDKLSQTRIKDLERLVLSYGTFRYMPKTDKNLFNEIMDELRKPEREIEIMKHGRSFACCVQYFGLMSLYPLDLMKKVFNPIFLEKTYGKQCYFYGREILCINNSAKIFLNEEKINLLSDKEVNILAKKYTDYMPSEDYKKKHNVTEKMILDIMEVLTEIRGGSDFVIGDHIVSHHQRGDIILCNTPDGVPVPVVNKFCTKKFGLIQRPPDSNNWIVLVIAGKNGIINGVKTPTGQFYVKVEELRQLGYYPNLVLWTEYSTLETFEQKEEYLNKCIKEAINTIKL